MPFSFLSLFLFLLRHGRARSRESISKSIPHGPGPPKDYIFMTLRLICFGRKGYRVGGGGATGEEVYRREGFVAWQRWEMIELTPPFLSRPVPGTNLSSDYFDYLFDFFIGSKKMGTPARLRVGQGRRLVVAERSREGEGESASESERSEERGEGQR